MLVCFLTTQLYADIFDVVDISIFINKIKIVVGNYIIMQRFAWLDYAISQSILSILSFVFVLGIYILVRVFILY